MQIQLNNRGQLVPTTAPPRHELVLWQGKKLQWPVEVLERQDGLVKIKVLNKTKSIKTVEPDTLQPFVFSVQSSKNNELRNAYRKAREMEKL